MSSRERKPGFSGRESNARRLRIGARCLLAFCVLSSSVACWEQWSESWFPQMKWQKTVQAFERVEFNGQIEGFVPPEGSVPIGGEVPSFERFDPGVDTLVNPTNPTDWKSITRGKEIYTINCETCHGATGMGDGPVSAMRMPTSGDRPPGPFAGVFPLITAMSRSDGYIYNIVRNGAGRMPNYRRIPDEDRWHLVNYVRYLQRGGQP